MATARVDVTIPSATRGLGIFLMLCSAFAVCIGQLLWKLGAHGDPVLLGAGFVLYGAGAVLMLLAYRHGELSVLQPLLGFSYVLSLVLAAFFLHEELTLGRVIGVVLVVSGVVLLARDGQGTHG